MHKVQKQGRGQGAWRLRPQTVADPGFKNGGGKVERRRRDDRGAEEGKVCV